MPFCRYRDTNNEITYGLYRDGSVCPFSEVTDDPPRSAHEIIQRGSDWLSSLAEPNRWYDAPSEMLPPIPSPQKIICIGLNYRDHARETGKPIPTEPVVFNKFVTALVGSGGEIVLPKIAERVDFEAELVVVMGAKARKVSTADAIDYVYGFACGHDVSARDWQHGRPGGQWLLGKTFDSFAPIGPCVATRREVSDPHQLAIRMRLNGETMQDSSSNQLIFDIPTLVSHLSQIMTLHAGDLIYTGTPPGVGVARKPPVFLKPGDVCEVEIDEIGTLVNRCVAE